MVWKIRQATVKGYAECEVGGWQTCHTQHRKHEEEERRWAAEYALP